MRTIAWAVSSTILALAGAAWVAACENEATPSPGLDAGSLDASFDSPSTPPTPAQDAQVNDAAPDAAEAAAPVAADLAKDFSRNSNPNGAWTFGYTLGSPEGDAGALIPFSMEKEASDVYLWFDPTHVSLDAPSVFRNASTVTVNGIAPGEAGLHPGSAQEYAVARWTAPAAGKYAVKVQFKAGDTGDTNGLLLQNGVVLVNEASTSTDAIHEITVTLAAGDKLDIAVGNKGDFTFDSTPAIFAIKTAP